MKLPAQIITSCRGQATLITCPNCNRILYFTRDMILTAAE
jgi:predicted  nucleic acid-binding Zn-ribbon protein